MTADLRVQVAITGDSPKWSHWVHARPDHHDNSFVIDVPPLSRTSNRDVSEAVLAGLGKDRRLRVAKRSVETLAAAWLSVTDCTDALIADTTVIAEPVLDDVVTLLVGFGIRPWLIVPWGDHHDTETREAAVDALVERYDANLIGPEELVPAWPDQTQPMPCPAPASWPIVPRVDGHFFRPAVRDLLEPDDAAFVDRYFHDTVQAIAAELVAANAESRTRQFERDLRARLHDAVTDEELITIVRAAQVAGSRHQFHVAVNPVRLYGACSILPRRGHIVRDDWWTKLARYPDPDVPAIAALHMAELDLKDIKTLNTDAVIVQPDRSVTVTGASGNQVHLSGPGATFVRAAANWRYFSAGPGPLFSTHRAESISDKRVGHLARAPMELGIRHTGPKAHRTEPTAARWLGNFGIKISRNTKARQR